MQWDVIASNPAALVHPPRVAQTEIEIIREDEIKTVLGTLRNRDLPLYTIAMLALATGMRRDELVALRWKDVDFDGGKLRVEQSLKQTRAGLRFKAPKTKHGRRAISIPPAVVADLRAQESITRAAPGSRSWPQRSERPRIHDVKRLATQTECTD